SFEIRGSPSLAVNSSACASVNVSRTTSASEGKSLPLKMTTRIPQAWAFCLAALLAGAPLCFSENLRELTPFLSKHCLECHDSENKKGGLDLSALKRELSTAANFKKWVTIYDRVSLGEMPPKKKPRPEPADLEAFTHGLSASLTSAEQERLAGEGRATQR